MGNTLKEKLIQVYIENREKGVKYVEVAIQKVIEDQYPDNCWWEVCDIPIFTELICKQNPIRLIDDIVDCCNKFNYRNE